MNRLVILAPNWLGDAVMALPAIADVRRHSPRVEIIVAARRSVAPLFRIVGDVDGVIDAAELDKRFDAALLLPNSFRAAVFAVSAGIEERWGYRTQWRAPLLTRGVVPARGLHQVAYYQYLVHALGFPNGPVEPRIEVPAAAREQGARVLREAGWDGRSPVAALAPGAAYGGAKRWPPEYFAELAAALAADAVTCVIVGAAADGPAADMVGRLFEARLAGGPEGPSRRPAGGSELLVSLVGKTDLPMLAGVLANCRALVTNDSGAMHLGAAVGVPVTAVFGPTDDRATRPTGDAHRIVTNEVWCRPCMLRECPLDHRCMRGVLPAAVAADARRSL